MTLSKQTKKYILFVPFTCAIWVYGQKKSVEKHCYPSGQVEWEMRFDSSCNCVDLTQYYESGNVLGKNRRCRISAITSRMEGAEISYYENGIVQTFAFWKDGVPEGRLYVNYPNGQTDWEKFCTNKFKTGIWKRYNKTGTLKEEEIFVDKTTLWGSNDDYATKKEYFNGKLAYTVDLVKGVETDLVIVDTVLYGRLNAEEQPLGKAIFLRECAQCHGANVDIAGPKLAGIAKRRNNEWLVKMVTNGDTLIAEGNKDAIALYEKYGQIKHPNFERLDKEQIFAVINYIKSFK
ncbi:c-type cytochrome [Taibaiella soli]|uniref:Cytochrome c domain-containing protein n=1 Tax=Taibaiella soli TaxID=1649169 RepID=A0A2W2BCK6_9BACT|nr:c-type cytochrome [Taibaiella soli]PZF73607.1 hypothetical protein DN068_07750 [Taibaiella soli]